MKYALSILILFSCIIGNSQNICVSVDCKDSIKYPTVITLNGSSQSSDGIKTRKWIVTNGTATINNPNVDSTFATASVDGLYVFQLNATSNQGATGTAFDSVYYVANKPPVAIVGQSILSTDGTATLSGSNSTDPEGLPLTFSWKQLSGPTTAAIASPTTSNPVVTGMISGTYVFTLTVTDQGGLTNSASQLVQVNLPVIQVKTVITTVRYFSDGSTTTTVVTTVP
jgi:PKD domain